MFSKDLSILSRTKDAYRAPFIQDPEIIQTRDNTNFLASGVSEQLKVHPVSYVYALAHEIRNPLTNIKLSVEMLGSLIQNNDLKIYLDIILRNSDRINNLIIEFLSYPLSADVVKETYSVRDMLEEILGIAADRIGLKNIAVYKLYDTQDLKISLNLAQIKIAITNIIVNSIEAMNLKTGQLTVTAKPVKGKYMIKIEDNGCGISKENLKHIFKPFYSSKPGGLGIGLSTTIEILRLNNIEVIVKSKEGLGTCFILLFNQEQLG